MERDSQFLGESRNYRDYEAQRRRETAVQMYCFTCQKDFETNAVSGQDEVTCKLKFMKARFAAEILPKLWRRTTALKSLFLL
jgi:hypothetical protein